MTFRSVVCALAILTILSYATLHASDVQLGATFVCNGERLYVENCNIRDLSDSANCMVAHPDRPQKNGLMVYTYETRGSLKKLLPTCKQPSSEEVRKANDFQRMQSQKLAANIKKANDELDDSDAKWEAAINGGHALSAEERQMYRCIAAGRASDLCTGKIFSNFLASAINMLLPGAVHEGEPGLSLAGRYQGKGWLIDFDSRSADTACSILSYQPLDYTVELNHNLPVITIQTKPKNLVLTGRPDGALVGAGPITVDGFIVERGSGGGTYTAGQGTWESHTETTTHEYTPLEAASVSTDPTLHQNGAYYYTTSTNTFSTYKPATPTYSGPSVTLIPKTANCTQPVLAAPAAAKDTTLGLRMRGTYEGMNGLSIEFYPDSAIVGCGKVARAYPYIVRANGAQAAVRIEDPAHPLLLSIKADGELDPGQGQFAVLGRTITGSTNGKLTFAPISATCNLETLAAANAAPMPSKPSSAPSSATTAGAAMSSPAGGRAPAASNAAASSPNSTTSAGNAILIISSGLPAQPGTPNPLANHPYILLRNSFANVTGESRGADSRRGVALQGGRHRMRQSHAGLPENYGCGKCQCRFGRAGRRQWQSSVLCRSRRNLLPDDFYAVQQSGAGVGHAGPTQDRQQLSDT